MLAKVRDDAPFDPICYIGCGATTGLGAALFAAKVEAGSSVVIFGLGGIGLNVVQGARLAGAKKIIGVDTNPAKEAIARQFGATDFVNPKAVEKLTSHLMKLTAGGADYTFECIGNPQVMRQAFECTNPAWGTSYVVGVAPQGAEVTSYPGHLMMGRHWTGCYMGGARLTKIAGDRRLVRREEDRSRSAGDASIEAGADQRRLRADAHRRIDPLRDRALISSSQAREK